MLNFLVLYISGKQDSDLGNRLGCTIPSKKDGKNKPRRGHRKEQLPRKPVAINKERKDAMECQSTAAFNLKDNKQPSQVSVF